MTKKDYVAIAAIAAVIKEVGDTPKIWRIPPGNIVRLIAVRIADGFAEDNGRFDKARFLRACGILD